MQRKVRWGSLLTLALFAAGLVVVVATLLGVRIPLLQRWLGPEPKPAAVAAKRPSVAEERARRLAPAAVVAPVPVPTTIVDGPDGRDADGYPLKQVDRAAVRALLHHRRFAELARHVEQLQSDFEADRTREYWPSDAADAFDSAEAELGARLDAWVAATPASFAPYLARGTYWVAAAYARRGRRWAAETAREDLALMREAVEKARADLTKALAIRPELAAAERRLIVGFRLTGDRDGARAALERAVRSCPSCFQVRVAYLIQLQPRWGGSYEEMLAFAKAAGRASKNPKLRLLPGYVDLDKANMLALDKKLDEALAAVERACALGEHWEFLKERAYVRRALKQLDAALADLDRAAAIRPGHPDILNARAFARADLRRWEAAARDLVAAIRVDPTSAASRTLMPYVVKGLDYDAWQRHKAGDTAGAVRLLDLALGLDPQSRELQRRRAWMLVGGTAGATLTPQQAEAAARAKLRSTPDDLATLQQLDYALAAQRRFDEVVKLWDDFLSRHPTEGRAFLGRGGAYYHLRRLREAHADAQKACELGVSEACSVAKRVAGMIR
jgi:tetratricopeptide (TPR) repeat protein